MKKPAPPRLDVLEMNCKPGDLSVIVDCRNWDKSLLGAVVTLECVGAVQGGVYFWAYGPCLMFANGRQVALIADFRLQPIRPPAARKIVTTDEVATA